MLPNLIIIIVSVALLMRVLGQKYRTHQRVQWRRHRKMAIQLLLISFLCLIVSFPNIIMTLLHLSGLSNYTDTDVETYANFFFRRFLFFSVSDFRAKINKILSYHRPSSFVVPTHLR
ncbi:unnamed protein product [Rotaria socialis]|uniref:G-protein coupled receptors family 1 profile domain-containing protein n=1 Tax=Rotaria socialis TaxID=392032 RepID=A0A821HVG9_9BILA|nr:unnamed protein product [Rotaria socialis]